MYKWRRQHENEQTVIQAWQQAALTAAAYVGKLPPLEKLLAQLRPKPTIRAQMNQLANHLGVTPRPLSPEAIDALRRLDARRRSLAEKAHGK